MANRWAKVIDGDPPGLWRRVTSVDGYHFIAMSGNDTLIVDQYGGRGFRWIRAEPRHSPWFQRIDRSLWESDAIRIVSLAYRKGYSDIEIMRLFSHYAIVPYPVRQS